jgi:hypothetical protein
MKGNKTKQNKDPTDVRIQGFLLFLTQQQGAAM